MVVSGQVYAPSIWSPSDKPYIPLYIWHYNTHTQNNSQNLSSVYAIHNVLDTKNPVGKSRRATDVLWGRGVSQNGAEFVFVTEFSEATVCTSYNVQAFWKSGNIF
jgi:hypothetical protein